MKIENKLLPKQERFCKEYVTLLDGQKSAILAGYSKKNAKFTASKILANPLIKKRIAELQKELSSKMDITQEKVVNEYASLAFAKIKKGGNVKASDKLHSLDSLCKVLGFNAPVKQDITTKGEAIGTKVDLSGLTIEELRILTVINQKLSNGNTDTGAERG